jgi:MFS family permease
MSRFRATFQSLQNRNFRLFFVGQTISASGTWMQKIGQAWLVLELTDSGTLLGVAAALQHLPTLIAGPWGGLISDRVDKRKLIILVESIAGLLALVLAVLTLTEVVELWMVLLLALGLGITDAFDRPARRSFVLEMVSEEHVTNAITLSAVVANAARAIGPAIAGILIAEVGIATTFFINAASYAAVVIGLLLMRDAELRREKPVARERGQVREGILYAARSPALAGPIALMMIASLVAFEWNVTLPLLARDAFGADPQIFGLLFSAVGLGAVVGGLGFASILPATNKVLLVAATAFGGFLLIISVTPSLQFALVVLFFVGASSITFKAQTNALAQLRSNTQMRGRVAALVSVATAGMTPIGGPLIGWIGDTYGARTTFVVGGASTILAALIIFRYLRRHGEVGAARSMSPEEVRA